MPAGRAPRTSCHRLPCLSSTVRLPSCNLRERPDVRNTSRVGTWVVKPSALASVAPLATITSPLADSMALTTASVEGACTKAADHRCGVCSSPNAHQLAFACQTGEGLIHRSSGGQMQELFGRQQAAFGQGLCSRQDGFSKMAHDQTPFVRSVYRFLTNCKRQLSEWRCWPRTKSLIAYRCQKTTA